MSPRLRFLPLLLVSTWLASARAHAATDPLETVEVTGSRAAVRKEIQTFVSQVTRADGELIGRWRDFICPLVVGVTDQQAQFIRNRLVEIQSTVRKHREDPGKPCKSNLFVIITEDADHVIEEWKQRDPGMFRWKTREGVSRSIGAGSGARLAQRHRRIFRRQPDYLQRHAAAERTSEGLAHSEQ